MNLAALSLRRPVTAWMFFVSMLLIGLIAAFRLPLEFMPEVEAPFLFIDLPYQGSTPEEIEDIITRPAEEALATLPGIKRLNSQSRSDGAGIFLEFDWSRDAQIAAADARERLDAIRDELPSDFQRYFVMKFASGDEPVLRVRLSSDRDLGREYDLLEREFKRRLERVAGVARVDISGIAAPEVEIALDSDRITAHGVDLNALAQRLSAANFSVSAGQILSADQRLRVQPVGEFRTLDELRALPIAEPDLRLRDVAEVSLAPGEIDYGRRLDGRPAVGIDVFKERNANLVETARRVLAEVDTVAKLPEFAGIQLFVMHDQAEGVTSSLAELGEAGLLGTALSVLVLFFFLRHWPSTLMVSLAIPICFVMTLGMMYFLGISLNILSMMGLLLGVGMLVDNAVVVVESIYQKREKYPDNPWLAAIEGTRSVQISISAGTLTSVIVFLPNIFGERNFIAIYLSQVAFTITISLLCSWLVAVSLIPMLSARMKTPEGFLRSTGLVHAMQDRYARILAWTLAHPRKTLALLALAIGVSFFPASQTNVDMFPSGETRELELTYRWNGSYRLEELSAAVKEVEDYLEAHRVEFEITQIYSWYSERGWAGTRLSLREEGDITPTLQLMEKIREGLPQLALGEVGFDDQNRGPGGASGEGLQVMLVGDSAQVLAELSDSVVETLSKLPGARDVYADLGTKSREVQILVDRDRALQYGFSTQQIASYVSIALRGTPLREFRSAAGEVPVWLRFAESDDASVDDLRDLKLRAADGSMIPLMSMISLKVQAGASTITRQNRQTALPIKINLVDGVSMEQARKDLEAAMASIQLPAGYRLSLGGVFDDADDAMAQMGFNTLIALLMVMVIMAAVFESLLFPLVIVTGFGFSIFGVYWLFWLTGTTFSLMAMIGILVLMGVVVNNGIVMVEHVNELRRNGMARDLALVQGCRDRLRPILMTMGTAILGMLPLCVGGTQIGGDGPPYFPMARAIVGGLVFSTAVSLLVLPVLYSLMDRMRLRTTQRWRDALDRVKLRSPQST
ncbi:MAG TPA: efflux RND transporter permease subunit [Aquimonas sp.]|mgnify:FL=1|jgi:HAE1 family hydrophobic/amphiphilic exporter-1|nr:efflux RND transporter permease subunit [Xanthomonadales bacterium]HRD72606.1 efflux RND transporter permease subunit [Aquimonas sp.]HRF55158.1 efflux RND transporter permease subunit [Aquimonas sp.]